MARSEFLAGIMRERGISQGALIRLTGLSKPTIQDAFHGRPVSPWSMAKIAAALDVPLKSIDPDAAEEVGGLRIG